MRGGDVGHAEPHGLQKNEGVVDSGACTSMMATGGCPDILINNGPNTGRTCFAATGGTIVDKRKSKVRFEPTEEEQRILSFERGRTIKHLVSVGVVADKGHLDLSYKARRARS